MISPWCTTTRILMLTSKSIPGSNKYFEMVSSNTLIMLKCSVMNIPPINISKYSFSNGTSRKCARRKRMRPGKFSSTFALATCVSILIPGAVCTRMGTPPPVLVVLPVELPLLLPVLLLLFSPLLLLLLVVMFLFAFIKKVVRPLLPPKAPNAAPSPTAACPPSGCSKVDLPNGFHVFVLGPTITVNSSVPACSFTAWSTMTEMCGLEAITETIVSDSSPCG
mmetsp:Transcript_9082/g.15094  ORF Transcript_9082/g.15094 Transcript_9082/m.15094 type:complete len:222 (-) Transcript_9082:745-1410(-)